MALENLMGAVLLGSCAVPVLAYFIFSTWGPGGGSPHGLIGFAAVVAAGFLMPASLLSRLLFSNPETFLPYLFFGWLQCMLAGWLIIKFCRRLAGKHES